MAENDSVQGNFFLSGYEGALVVFIYRFNSKRTMFSSPTSRKTLADALTNKDDTPSSRLGTLSGVFLPCLQNILGVILFLRLPFIVAQAGCVYTSIIIVTCVGSTFLTSLSLSAIASNGTIRAGGPYYVLSRTLGFEVGASLGVLFYLATSIAGSMYVLGAVEAILTGFGLENKFQFDMQAISLALMLLIALIVAVGVKQVNQGAIVFLAIVLASVFSLVMGAILFAAGAYDGELDATDRAFGDNIWPSYSPDPATGEAPTFLSLLALFYPSVTGIMAGSNRSAVLSQPSRSIPLGTMSAIAATTAIYLSVVWIYGNTFSRETLMNDNLIVASVAYPSGMVVRIGIIMSCVGAALQSMVGAPRLLAAIASDGCIPYLRFFKPKTESSNPIRAVALTWFIASIPTLAGSLNAITPLITIMFLSIYAGINLSTLLLSVLRAPGFRPTFRYFNWATSLLGFLWCIGLAFVMSWSVTLAVIGLGMILFFCIWKTTSKNRKTSSEVGDLGSVIQGVRFSVCHTLLNKLVDSDELHAKNWRPLMLTIVEVDHHGVVSDSGTSVIKLTGHLRKGRGMSILAGIMEGSQLDADCARAGQLAKSSIQKQATAERLKAFTPSMAFSRSQGIGELVGLLAQHSGIGPIRPNTIVLPWPQEPRSDASHDVVTALRYLVESKKTVLALRACPNTFPGASNRVLQGTIDVWWICHDGGLLLLLPFLLSKSSTWKGARLRLFVGATAAIRDMDRFKTSIENHLNGVRISAEVAVVDLSHVMPEFTNVDLSATFCGEDEEEGIRTAEHALLRQISPLKPSSPSNRSFDDGASMFEISTIDSMEVEEPARCGQILDFGSEGDDVAPAERDGGGAIRSAMRLNRAIRERSEGARLVVTNLPLLRPATEASAFVDYVDAMCRGIDNVLLVRGSGGEVITHYA